MLIVEKDGKRRTYKTKEDDILPTFVFAHVRESFKDWKPRKTENDFYRDRVVYGIGRTGIEYRTHKHSKPTTSFKIWKRMLSMNDVCKVCDEWLYYPTFHRWWLENYTSTMQEYAGDFIVVVDNERVNEGYSPLTAKLLPAEVVEYFNLRIKDNGLPKGIVQRNCGYNYGKIHHMKYARTLKKAVDGYNQLLKKKSKELIDIYGDVLDTEVVEKLNTFKFVFGCAYGKYGTYVG